MSSLIGELLGIDSKSSLEYIEKIYTIEIKTMKSIKYIAIAAGLSALTACQKEDVGGFSSDPDAVRITAVVGDLTESRVNPIDQSAAARTTFAEGEQIKVSADSQDAVTYTLTNGIWTPAPGTYLKWENQSHTFNAYYPVSYTGAEDATVVTDQSELYGISQADYAKCENLVWDKAIGPVEFVMQRQTARIVISEVKWEDQYDADIYQIFGLTLTDGVSGRIEPYKNGDGKYYALLMPTAGKTGLEGNFIEMTVWDGNTEASKESHTVRNIPELEAGYSYECTLTIGKEKLSIGSVTVAEWATGGILNEGEGLTEEYIPYTVTEVDGVKTYVVDSEAGLRAVNRIITSDVNELGSGIILAADITLTGENNWIPIGSEQNPYTGIFNGNSKTITGLHINDETADYQGLIGYLSNYGMVKDLTLANSFITGGEDVGGVVGFSANSSIMNVTVKDCEINGKYYVGGIIGSVVGTVTFSGATLLDSKVTGVMCVGGIAGYVGNNIENCLVQSNAGKTVTITALSKEVGGIAGVSNSSISGCKVINGGVLTISTDMVYAGGIAGNMEFGDIIACLVQGANVTCLSNGNRYAGGIVGQSGSSCNLSGSYAYGCTTGTTPEAFTDVANIIRINNGTVTSCYYHAYNDSWEDLVTPVANSSGELEPGTPVDWTTASENMNRSLNESGYRYVWGGTYDAPTLTAR